MLTFPTGRIRSRRDWLILGAAVVVFVPLELVWLLFFDLDGLNAIAFWADAGVADAIDWVQRVLLVVVDTALIVVVYGAGAREPAAAPHATPVIAGVVALAVGTFALLWDKIAGARTELIGWLTSLTMLALPALLLFNLLRIRLARSGVGQLLIDLRERQRAGRGAGRARPRARRPGLGLAFWLPEYDAYVDTAGNPVVLPVDDATRVR